jgi:cytochrome P450
MATPEHPGGKSLFFLNYDLWKPSRQLISPAFSDKNINKIKNLIENSHQLFMNNVEKYAISGEAFDVRPCLECFVLDTILRAFFGTKVDSANEPNNPLVKNSTEIFMKNISIKQLIAYFAPTISKWFDIRFVDRHVGEYMAELVKTIINERKLNNIVNNDLLQILLDSKNDSQKTSKISQ